MDVLRGFNYYSFDVMGDLSFGKSFGVLVEGRDGYIFEGGSWVFEDGWVVCAFDLDVSVV